MNSLSVRSLASLLVLGCAVMWPLSSKASYFDLVPSSKKALEIVTYDVRYPYGTKHIYIATYPHHSMSREGWNCEYYGGVQLNAKANNTFLLWSTWGVKGQGAPASGIDFVHAGPRLGWHRSTWEGSSGSVNGTWPAEEFKVNQWYRFVHRVWTPTDHTPHTGYAGVWMKSLETGEWFHMATFKFPAELTGFNNMGGFMEWFGPTENTQAAAEFRNCYTFDQGAWHSRTNFAAHDAGDDSVKLVPGENGEGVLVETTRNAIDPKTGKSGKNESKRTQAFILKQPEQPQFLDAAKIVSPSAEWMGNQVVVRWSVDKQSAPQLGYDVEVDEGDSRLAAVSWNDPEARQCVVTLPAAPKGKVSVRLTLRDIFNQTSSEEPITPIASKPLATATTRHTAPGLVYRYFEAAKSESWHALPDFTKLTPASSGVIAMPEITPRHQRNNYAFDINGFLQAPTDGIYAFNLVAASGAALFVDGKKIIDADGDRSIARYPGSVALKAGYHSIQILFYHGLGRPNQADDFLQLTWSGPGFASQPVPASAFSHAVTGGADESALVVEARREGGARLELSSRLTGAGGKLKRMEYYAVNDHFDYFGQQGAQFANYFLASTDKPGQPLTAAIWGGPAVTVFARAILDNGCTVDSAPVTVRAASPAPVTDAKGMTLTELEHHLYPVNHSVENGVITLVGESMALLTRPHKGDVTVIAHLNDITSNKPLADGTRLESAGNWFAGIILRDNLNASPGEPFGGKRVPYIMVGGSADGTTRHCNSMMIDGAGNQLSGDVGRAAKWLKLTRKGQQLAASISKDGQIWKQVSDITLPQMKEEIQVGFVQYALPCAVPRIHWSKFDQLSITDSGN